MPVLALCQIFKKVLHAKSCVEFDFDLSPLLVRLPESGSVPQVRFPPRNLKVFLICFPIVSVLSLLQLFTSAFLG